MSTALRYGMGPEDVYLLAGVADPQISPDGTQVAYQEWWVDREDNAYRGAIWAAPLDGADEPRRLTFGERMDAAPRWSPDGRWLAFTSSRGGDKSPAQLYVLPAAGGEARRLTEGTEDVGQLAWSPDSARIAFTMRVRDETYAEEDELRRPPRRVTRLSYKQDSVGWIADRRSHVFIADTGGGVRQLTDGDCEDGQPAWSPDGTRIAFASMRGERWDVTRNERIYLVGAEGGEPVPVTGEDVSCSGPVFSPDGTQIAFYLTPEDGTYPHNGQVAVGTPEGSRPRVLTGKLDRQCQAFPGPTRLAWDGDRIFFTAEDHGNRHVYAVAADGSAPPQQLTSGEQVISEVDARAGQLAYISTTHTELAGLFMTPVGAGDGRLVSRPRPFGTGERTLALPERFTAVSADGTEVDAWIVPPAAISPGERYPVLLSIHGGPFTQYGTGFMDEFQVYAGAGYAVLFANPRGSSGRSQEWGQAIRGPEKGAGPGWGTVDYQDVLGVVDTALDRFPYLDKDRMGVLGGSYGGFMTSWIISHTDRFSAALSERACNNLVSMFGSSDIFWGFQDYFGAAMWEAPDAWRAMSPATYAADIRTPVLIMHSEQDLRCPIEQGEHLFTILRLLGREAEMLRFPAESHELSRAGSPLHRVQRFEAILEWFGRYLGG